MRRSGDLDRATALAAGFNAQGCAGAAKDRKSESGQYRSGTHVSSAWPRLLPGMACMPVLQEQKPVIDAWRSAGVWAFLPFPRLVGVTSAPTLLLGANTPIYSACSTFGKTVYSWQVAVIERRNKRPRITD